MSQYHLQKLCRAVNNDPAAREKYLADPKSLMSQFELTDGERQALATLDIDALYNLGVHPLLLKPFTVINGISQDDYLAALNPESGK